LSKYYNMTSYAITGAARGIGFEFVNQLSAVPDHTVFALVRNRATASRLVDLNRSNVHIIEADITNLPALKAAAARISEVTAGSLDVLINNAAFVEDQRYGLTLDSYPSEELLTKDLVDSFNINVVGVVHTINTFLPLLKNGKSKKVITISTGAGDLDMTLQAEFAAGAPYAISKAAINMVNVKYAVQYRSEGFVFLAISPGLVDTSTKPPTAEELEQFGAMVDKFKIAYPDFTGPISPETSVKLQLEVIEQATVRDTGAFISHKGNKEWL
jgi:NAD(P)-dependent dehydrogenase (short-subunit alcohol dehydrogenase family)